MKILIQILKGGLLALLFSCSPPRQESVSASVDPDFKELDDAYYAYVIGDWGRKGEYRQKELAGIMGAAARVVEPEFIASTGDNFYPDGVGSIQDPNWKYSFEDIYDDFSLNCDWYVTLGNHDYRGNVEAQIEYTGVSRRWNMPDRYYHKDVTTDQGASVRFLFIDTNPLNDEYYEREKYKPYVTGQDTVKQLVWMDSLLSDDYDYKIVIGHHPIYSGGKRSDEMNFVKKHINPLLKKHEVALYIAGHEHDLQHIKLEDESTHHIISGAGSEIRPTGTIKSTLFSRSVQGFLVMAIQKEKIQLQFMDVNGKIIYHTSI